MTSNVKTTSINKKPLIILTLFFSIILSIGAYSYYSYQENQIRNEKQKNLIAISQLKINQITKWKEERLSEAQFFPGNETVILKTKQLIIRQDNALKKYFRNTLNPIKVNHGYENIFITSTDGRILFSLDTALKKINFETSNTISLSFKEKKIIFNDFYYSTEHKEIHLEIISPIIDKGEPIAAMVFRLNTNDYLYPLIQSWPVYSRTAETLIFRVEKNHVVFLNELRHKKNTALKMKIPLNRQEILSVKGAKGLEGVMDGKDYRGEKVLGAVYKIPGSPWLMVAKIDHSEVYEEVWYTAVAVTAITTALIGLSITLLTLFYERTQKKMYYEMMQKDRAIAETFQEFRTTLYSIGDAVITTDVKGCIKHMNNVAEELTGWKENEAKGKYISEVFKILNEDTRNVVDNPVERVLAEGVVIGLGNHTVLISKTGFEIPITDSGSPIRDESGNITGVILVFRDQSSEREAESKLRESEERYRRLFQNNYIVMLLVDPDTAAIIDANPAACRFYGYSHKEITQLKIWNINQLPPETLLEKIKQVKKSEASQFVFSHKLADGSLRDVEVYTSSLNLNGKSYLYSIVHDITERRQTEEALKASEDKFSKAFKTSPDAININRLSDGLFYEVNDGFTRLTGYTPEDVNGKTSNEIQIWAKPEERKKLASELITYGEVTNMEASFRLKDGTVKTALMSARIIKIKGEDYILSITRDITERKIAEEALKKSEERLRLFVEYAPAAIAMLDNQMRYINVSKRWLKDYNLDEDKDITGLSHYEVFPEIPERWKEIHRRCLAGNSEKCDEDPFPRADGRMDWIRWEIHPWQNEKNEIGGLIVLSEVITERKKAEEVIKEKARLEEQISKIAITAPGGVYSFKLNPDGSSCFPFVSPIWEEIFGLKGEELVNDGSSIFKIIHPNDIEALNSSIEKSAKEMNDWRLEFRIMSPAKGFIWVEGHSTPIKQNDGSIIWHGFITNITERKSSEERIKKLSRGIEQSPAIIVMTDINGLIEYVNPKFTEVTGYTLNEVKGKNPRILKSGNTTREEYELLWNTILSKNEWHGDLLNKKKSGELYWESASISPLLNEKGEIISFIAVKEDITAWKKMTNELIEAKEKAEEMNRIKSNFFANISHELRTPFVGIIGFSELLSEKLENPDEKRMAEIILSSSKRLTETLNKILDISKLEFDKIETKIKETDVFHVIESIYHLYNTSAEKHNSRIKMEFNAAPLFWRTDEKLLREIVGNIINNAVKFTYNGLINILTGIYPIGSSNSLVIKITDTGVGIPKDKQEIIWQEFRQASEGYGRSFEGTGLGLSITRKYVELLGGKITLESEPGKGSSFTIILPEVKEKRSDIETETLPLFPETNDTVIRRNPSLKLLYIEDDTVSIEYVKKVLSKYYTVEIADDAETAMENIKTNDYDALLLDINLGYGMNGVELMQKVKEMPNYKNKPIVAVTAYASSSNKKEFLSKGFSHYISKPFSSKELIELLEEILKTQSA